MYILHSRRILAALSNDKMKPATQKRIFLWEWLMRHGRTALNCEPGGTSVMSGWDQCSGHKLELQDRMWLCWLQAATAQIMRLWGHVIWLNWLIERIIGPKVESTSNTSSPRDCSVKAGEHSKEDNF